MAWPLVARQLVGVGPDERMDAAAAGWTFWSGRDGDWNGHRRVCAHCGRLTGLRSARARWQRQPPQGPKALGRFGARNWESGCVMTGEETQGRKRRRDILWQRSRLATTLATVAALEERMLHWSLCGQKQRVWRRLHDERKP